jgi:hypothetical protein
MWLLFSNVGPASAIIRAETEDEARVIANHHIRWRGVAFYIDWMTQAECVEFQPDAIDGVLATFRSSPLWDGVPEG